MRGLKKKGKQEREDEPHGKELNEGEDRRKLKEKGQMVMLARNKELFQECDDKELMLCFSC